MGECKILRIYITCKNILNLNMNSLSFDFDFIEIVLKIAGNILIKKGKQKK